MSYYCVTLSVCMYTQLFLCCYDFVCRWGANGLKLSTKFVIIVFVKQMCLWQKLKPRVPQQKGCFTQARSYLPAINAALSTNAATVYEN